MASVISLATDQEQADDFVQYLHRLQSTRNVANHEELLKQNKKLVTENKLGDLATALIEQSDVLLAAPTEKGESSTCVCMRAKL